MIRFWTNTTWASTVGALLATIAWVLTREAVAGWLALLLVVAALAAAYLAADEAADELGDLVDEPHPLDPHTEELRRRLALGRLQDRASRHISDDELQERGW